MKSVKVSDSSYEYIRNTAFHQRKTHQQVIEDLIAFKEGNKGKILNPTQTFNRVGDDWEVNYKPSVEVHTDNPPPPKKGNMEFEI